MIKPLDLKEGQIIYVLKQGSVENSRDFEKRYEEHVVDEVSEDRIRTHKTGDDESTREFINYKGYGLIENKAFFRNATVFETKKDALEFFNKNILENWFRVEFSKIPHTEYSLEKLREAKSALMN